MKHTNPFDKPRRRWVLPLIIVASLVYAAGLVFVVVIISKAILNAV